MSKADARPAHIALVARLLTIIMVASIAAFVAGLAVFVLNPDGDSPPSEELQTVSVPR